MVRRKFAPSVVLTCDVGTYRRVALLGYFDETQGTCGTGVSVF